MKYDSDYETDYQHFLALAVIGKYNHKIDTYCCTSFNHTDHLNSFNFRIVSPVKGEPISTYFSNPNTGQSLR